MQPSQMMTSRELCVAEDFPDLPAWKRPCGSRGVGSWRGAHLAMLVVRPFGRCSRSCGLPCSPLDDPVAGSSAGSSTCRSLARLPKEPLDANLSPSPHFGAFTLRPGRFNGLLSWVRPHGPVPKYRTMCLFAPPSTSDAASTPAPTRGSSLRPRGCHPRSLVPSSWFLTTSTASSAVSSAGLLHPAANPGVHRVVTRGAGPYPSKNSSPTAAPRHRGRCPLAVPTGFEALLRRRVWCRRPPLPADDDPLLPGLRSPSRFTSMRPEIHLPPPSPRQSAPPKGWFTTRQLRCRTRVGCPRPKSQAPGTLAAEASKMGTALDEPVPGAVRNHPPKRMVARANASHHGRSQGGEASRDRVARLAPAVGPRSGGSLRRFTVASADEVCPEPKSRVVGSLRVAPPRASSSR